MLRDLEQGLWRPVEEYELSEQLLLEAKLPRLSDHVDVLAQGQKGLRVGQFDVHDLVGETLDVHTEEPTDDEDEREVQPVDPVVVEDRQHPRRSHSLIEGGQLYHLFRLLGGIVDLVFGDRPPLDGAAPVVGFQFEFQVSVEEPAGVTLVSGREVIVRREDASRSGDDQVPRKNAGDVDDRLGGISGYQVRQSLADLHVSNVSLFQGPLELGRGNVGGNGGIASEADDELDDDDIVILQRFHDVPSGRGGDGPRPLGLPFEADVEAVVLLVRTEERPGDCRIIGVNVVKVRLGQLRQLSCRHGVDFLGIRDDR